jgi:penicillin-binding protein 1A
MTQRARRRHRRSRGSVGRKVLLALAVLVAIAGAGVAGVAVWVLDVRGSAPSLSSLKPIDQGEVSEVLASDGSRLGFIQSDVVREPVEMDEIPRELRRATIAIEDQDFYDHHGVDYGAVARAAWENATAGFVPRQGGSTVTQQLVRNLYLENPEDTIERKIIEAKLAEDLEERRTKRWILREYLNTASYGTTEGRTAIGVEAASRVYFDRPVAELDLRRSALLAGLPQAPSEYNPFQRPEAAKQRRNEVLQRMHELGFIDQSTYQQTLQRGLGLERGYRYTTIREPYFFDYVEQELIERYGVNTVRQGGLKVHTTIDPVLQEAATRAAQDGAARLGGPAAALVSIDPSDGNIVAMASSANYASAQYNLAAQGQRQPGSAFKPFALAEALKQGIDPDQTYYDGSSPTTLALDQYSSWTVNNAEGGSAGTMSLANATSASVNVIYAKLALDVGPENVAKTAKSLGITSPLDGFPAETIGGLRIGVSPLEMANAYATFAAGGVRHDATAIERVEFPDGEVDTPENPEGRQVLSDGIAYEITEILKQVVSGGTGTSASIGCPQAGKTGTTDNQTDAWFVGYTPALATAVWVGYPDARTSMGGSAFGGSFAAPIWKQYMDVAKGSFCSDFEQPQNRPSLSPYSGGHSASRSSSSSSSSSGSGTSYDYDYDSDTGEADEGDGSYDPDLYAPGAGQAPLPSPEQGQGQGQGGGNPGQGQGRGRGGND